MNEIKKELFRYCRRRESNPPLLIIMMLPLLLIAVSASGQSSSTNYALSAGSPIAGGNVSASTGYSLAGAVPISGAGYSTSSSYGLTGGIAPAIASAVTAYYNGSAEMTVDAAVNRTMEITIQGTVGADTTGTIYYRSGGGSTYTSAAMTLTGATLQYNLSGTLLGVRGLEYYFIVEVGSSTISIGTAADPYLFIVNMTNAQAQRPAAMPSAGYRIIGVPLSFTARQSAADVFADDLGAADKRQWRLADYDPVTAAYREYPDAGDVTPSHGYWLIARGGKKYGAAGYSMRPNLEPVTPGGPLYYQIAVDSGWNLLANPFPFAVSWTDIRFKDNDALQTGHPASVLDDFAYWYSGTAYSSATTIPAWEGFFVKINKRNIKILFPYSEVILGRQPVAKLSPLAGSPGDWEIGLRLEANGAVDDGNFAGVRHALASGKCHYNFSEPPPAPEGPMLAFRLQNGERGLFRTDYRAPFETGAVWEIEMAPMPGRALELSGLERIPDGMSAWLILDNGENQLLGDNRHVVLPDNVSKGQLLVGTEEYLKDMVAIILPKDYALFQNFPNPFNPSTRIRFALPKSDHVSLEIYNILGQVITTLVDRDLAAGYHSVLWDGTNSNGSEVGSGIYFYRLKTGHFDQRRMMLLIK